MKSLELHIQSSLESLTDCLQELQGAISQVLAAEDQDLDPPISSSSLDRVVAHCQKAQRELQTAAGRLR